MAAIFFSHSSRDDHLANALVYWLRDNGFDDLFIDHESIRSGDKWTEELRRAKGSCRVVLCLVTPNWLGSDECFGEFLAGWYAGRRVIPLVAIGDAALDTKQRNRLARVLSEDQGVDLMRAGAPDRLDLDNNSGVADPLKAGLRAAGALARVGLDPTAFEIDRQTRPEPFPGLQSFDDTDADASVFFGRSAEIAQCLEDLREIRASGDRRAYVIQGASGSGKSSLLKAGVLPRLRRERGFIVLRSFRPGIDPTLNFADAIVRSGFSTHSAGGLREVLWRGFKRDQDLKAVLGEVFAPLRQSQNQLAATVLISIDQGEELARTAGESGDCLAAYLKAALRPTPESDPAAYCVVLTVRSDAFPDLQASPRFVGLPTRTSDVRALSNFQYGNAIEQPALRYGVQIDPGFTDALLSELKGADALPLIAFAMQRIWRGRRDTRQLTRADLAGATLEGVVGEAAEHALSGLAPDEARTSLMVNPTAARIDLARRVFIPRLVRVNAAGAAQRRVTPLSAFTNAGEREFIEDFARWRLLTLRRGEDDIEVEVVHEAIFRTWARFRDEWLPTERANLAAIDETLAAAREWSENGQKARRLVHSGRDLKRSIEIIETRQDYVAILDEDNGGAQLTAQYLAASRSRERLRIGVIAATIALTTALAIWLPFQSSVAQQQQSLVRQASLLAEQDDASAALLAAVALRPPWPIFFIDERGAREAIAATGADRRRMGYDLGTATQIVLDGPRPYQDFGGAGVRLEFSSRPEVSYLGGQQCDYILPENFHAQLGGDSCFMGATMRLGAREFALMRTPGRLVFYDLAQPSAPLWSESYERLLSLPGPRSADAEARVAEMAAARGELAANFLGGEDDVYSFAPHVVALSDDGATLAFSNHDLLYFVTQSPAGPHLVALRMPETIYSIVWLGADSWLASGAHFASVVETDGKVSRNTESAGAPMSMAAIGYSSRTGTGIVREDHGVSIFAWQAPRFSTLHRGEDPAMVAFIADSGRWIGAYGGGWLTLYEGETARPFTRFRFEASEEPTFAFADIDGQTVLLAYEFGGDLAVFDLSRTDSLAADDIMLRACAFLGAEGERRSQALSSLSARIAAVAPMYVSKLDLHVCGLP